MKIICKDNFDRENVSERLVAWGIKDKDEGRILVNALNEKNSGLSSSNYYALKEDDYKLYRYQPYS